MSNRHYSVKEQDVEKFNSKLLSISNARMKETGRVFPTRTRSPNFSLMSDEREVFCLIRRPTQSIRETGHHSSLYGTHRTLLAQPAT